MKLEQLKKMIKNDNEWKIKKNNILLNDDANIRSVRSNELNQEDKNINLCNIRKRNKNVEGK